MVAQVTFTGPDGASETDTLQSFLEENRHDEEVCEAVRSLGVGGSVSFGGGASPLFTVVRIS